MKKIIFKIQFLWLIYILNFNSNQELINDIDKRSNSDSNIIKNVKNISTLINLSLIALNIKNFKNVLKNKNYCKNNKKQLWTIFGTLIWNLIYYRTVHPLYKNRQKIFNLNCELKDANYLIYENNIKNSEKDDNIEIIGITATKKMEKTHFLKHVLGFASDYCNGNEVYKEGNEKNIRNENIIRIENDKIIFDWNGDVCINDRESAGIFLSKYINKNILKNNKKLIFVPISYGNEVALNALKDLIENKNEIIKLKEILLFMITPPINKRYLNILDKFLELNNGNRIITLNNFHEEKLLIDISNVKGVFDFGRAQSDLTLFQNKEFYKKNKNKILGLMSIDKNSEKEITHYDLCLYFSEYGDDLIDFIQKKIISKEIEYGKNYFLSNFFKQDKYEELILKQNQNLNFL